MNTKNLTGTPVKRRVEGSNCPSEASQRQNQPPSGGTDPESLAEDLELVQLVGATVAEEAELEAKVASVSADLGRPGVDLQALAVELGKLQLQLGQVKGWLAANLVAFWAVALDLVRGEFWPLVRVLHAGESAGIAELVGALEKNWGLSPGFVDLRAAVAERERLDAQSPAQTFDAEAQRLAERAESPGFVEAAADLEADVEALDLSKLTPEHLEAMRRLYVVAGLASANLGAMERAYQRAKAARAKLARLEAETAEARQELTRAQGCYWTERAHGSDHGQHLTKLVDQLRGSPAYRFQEVLPVGPWANLDELLEQLGDCADTTEAP